MDPMKETAAAWIDSNESRGVSLLKKLVEQRSVQGNESGAQAIILEKCRQLGLQIDLWEPERESLKSHPHFYCTRAHFKDSPNIAAVLSGKGGGKSLILNGHIDVVPEGDLSRWEDEPYSASCRDGKVYGRGTSDMKGGTVALLMAMEALIANGIQLNGDVIFQSVIEEESGGAGTLAAAVKGYKADGALIPEPTGMKIFSKQQGSMWFKVKIRGLSAHGGTRYEGVSAIEKSYAAASHIKSLEDERNKRITDPLYETVPIPVPINIGEISGGNWPSSVPDLVIMSGRCGIAPDETAESVQQEFEEWMKTLAEKDPWFKDHPAEVEWYGARWLPNGLDGEHELLASLKASFLEASGKEAVVEASPWGTDGGMLFHAGGVPTVVFGPGATEAAHFPNEFIEVRAITECAKIIAFFLMDWCGTDDLLNGGSK
ncbi:peptidase [Metabacillus sp. GX 13764]|uniref:peptidase n=1 Tax=Metabacillus kandeliae TaxID=2900151 RepID=UPI001E3ADD44|nr:peptidase [Metabacillus kandeliae]MCD7033486.1 peptidase [Metabacillus kandeliae]